MRQNSSVKPYHTDQNKIDRFKSALDHLDYFPRLQHHEFKTMNNLVYIDEKWFRIMKQRETFYLAQDKAKSVA